MKRYSIENYLVDPIIVYIALMDKEVNFKIDGLNLRIGEEYKVKFMPSSELQLIVDSVLGIVEPELSKYFSDFEPESECEKVRVKFIKGVELLYPKWVFARRGKAILNELYNALFTSPVVNFTTLFKAVRKSGFLPVELVALFEELRQPSATQTS
ncbi:hypothetical protein B0919_24500 [Hymenobacter sp. CRA2]|nr:hypothetical protein B0919_24500 [Hymenobacter sp. CRA2]